MNLNLKEFFTVKTKHLSYSIQSIATCTGFANVGPVINKAHSLSSEHNYFQRVFINDLIDS